MLAKVLLLLVKIILGFLTTLIPLILLFFGCFFLLNEIFKPLISSILGITFPIYEKPVSWLNIIIGILLIIGGIFVILKIVKNRFSSYVLLGSFTIHILVIITFLIIAVSPLFDFLLINYVFNKGFCTLITATTQRNYELATDTEIKENARLTTGKIDDWCQVSSELFRFKYP